MRSPAGARAEPRPPAHAGTFYPADPLVLARTVDRLLARAADDARRIVGDRHLLGALVPHAGLQFSGAVAALGWRAAAATRPATILLLGTDHRGWSDAVAVWDDGPWTGPFGSVAVDERLAGRLLSVGDPFVRDPAAHLDEHSLEVQMPFIARACPGTRVVACSVGLRSPVEAVVAGGLLADALRDADAAQHPALLVASSDFAHYPPARVARAVGRRMLQPLLHLDATGLWREEARAAGLPGVACGMCGIAPAAVLLAAMTELAGEARLLGEATSADVPPHDAEHCVGYAAVAFTARPWGRPP